MTELKEPSIVAEINDALHKQKRLFPGLRTEPLKNRKERLKKLRRWIHQNRTAIHEATYADFQKAPVEVDATEIFHVLSEIKLALANLEEWTAPKKADATLAMLGSRSVIRYEPRGVSLIISPWNYPFGLAVGPLVSALAAGNSVILKPSELTPHTSALLNRLAMEVFNDDVVKVFEGGAEIAGHLLTQPFDHIFFTGSPSVGKIVMKAAAENLTPVTLELGGKSPAIVTSGTNIQEAAERMAVAKFVNNGQTCVAPDYVLVDEKFSGKLIAALKESTLKLFAGKNESIESGTSYCRIVNEKHFNRLNNLLQDALDRGAALELGGKVEASSRFMHPVILSRVAENSAVLEEEIFGPILPVLTYKNLEEAIALVNSKPKPLALYIFSSWKSSQKKILEETSSGGVCINDCAIHFLHNHLPFGGVNHSGIGKSHGHHGFLAFSNEKPVLKQKSGLIPIKLFYPPYTSFSRRAMDWFLKLF